VIVGQIVNFTGAVSFASPGTVTTNVSIAYGDGVTETPQTTGAGFIAQHGYTSAGTYTATLTVTGSNGLTGQASTQVVVTGGSAGPNVSVAVTPTTQTVGLPVTISYSATTSVGINFPTIRSMQITFGDGTPSVSIKPSRGTTAYTYRSPGTYTITVTATDSTGLQGQGQATVLITGPAQTPVVTLSASPLTATVGQAVNFTGAVSFASPGTVTTNVTIAYGDGMTETPQTTGAGFIAQHSYGSAATYTATLTVTDSNGRTGQSSIQVMVIAAGPTVMYDAGWNLVGGPDGTILVQVNGPLYTFQAGDTAYRAQPASSPITGGRGYWAYFSQPSTVGLSGTSLSTASVTAPAGQYVMVGNPSATATLTIRGADVAYIYNTSQSQYVAATTLAPGQGAWVLSNAGGTITIGP
jgi:PKD repeat protein